jgi:hypothetical protein
MGAFLSSELRAADGGQAAARILGAPLPSPRHDFFRRRVLARMLSTRFG